MGKFRMAKHSIETSDEAGVRYLHFGSEWVQGAMRIARPFALQLEYTRELMLALALRFDADWPRTVLQVGLGAASTTKFLHRHRPQCQQTIVELNPSVVPIARQMFKLPEDESRIAIEIGDGIAWMKCATQKYDFIIVDGYDHNARFGGLGTEDFYRDCKARLSREGVLALNLFGRARGYQRQLEALANVFGTRVLPLGANDEGNAVVFAVAGNKITLDMPSIDDACGALQTDTGIKWGKSMMRLRAALSDRRACTL
jgi:spermidine synthase